MIGHGGGSWVALVGLGLLAIGATIVICAKSTTLGLAARLMDRPDFTRKIHSRETPLIGGLATMVPTLGITLLYSLIFPTDAYLSAATFAASIVMFLGVLDDRVNLSAAWRLAGLIYVVFVAFSVEPEFILHSFNLNIFGFPIEIPFHSLAAPITLLIVIGFVNSVNLADGMNGQLLGSVIIWTLLLLPYADPVDIVPFAVLLACGAVTLVFNLRGKLFSGSAGAYSASLFIALCAIAIYRRSHGALPAVTVGLWFWLPVMDCMRVMVSRLRARKSPIEGDRDHLHHLLMAKFGPRLALPIYLLLLGLPGFAAEANPWFGQIAFAACVLAYVVLASRSFVHIDRVRAVRSIRLQLGE